MEVHLKSAHRPRQSTVALRQSQLVNNLTSLKCLEVSCGHQVVQTLKELKKHILAHLDKRETINCIFSECNFKTNNIGTFKSHISKKHRSDDTDSLKADISSDNIAYEEPANLENIIHGIGEANDEVFEDFNVEDIQEEDIENIPRPSQQQEYTEEELFLKALAITFCDWGNIKHIPYTTCNEIVKEVFKSYGMASSQVRVKINALLQNEGLDHGQIEGIFNELDQEDPFIRARKELEQESCRLNFLKNTFEFTEPETILLPTEKGKPRESYQYIPIKESLKILLEDPTYLKQKGEDPYFFDEGLVKDIRDGEAFRNNEFFKKNPDAVSFLMFQDELEGLAPAMDQLNSIIFIVFFCHKSIFSSLPPSRIYDLEILVICNGHLYQKCCIQKWTWKPPLLCKQYSTYLYLGVNYYYMQHWSRLRVVYGEMFQIITE